MPRIEAAFPAAAVLDDGDLLPLVGQDISRGGLGIACDVTTARTMVTHGSLTSLDAGAELQLEWRLPGASNNRPLLHGRVRLAWSRAMGGPNHRIGFEFVRLDTRTRELLAAFIEREMQ